MIRRQREKALWKGEKSGEGGGGAGAGDDDDNYTLRSFATLTCRRWADDDLPFKWGKKLQWSNEAAAVV